MQNSLVKTWLTVLGVGMLIQWIAGMSSSYASPTITWLDFGIAILSFVGVSLTKPSTDRNTRAGGTIALALGVFAIWLGGLVNGATAWLTWWNFAFACAYLFAGVAAAMAGDSGTGTGEQTLPFRRSA